jgi:arylsulfatase A-like enzyme
MSWTRRQLLATAPLPLLAQKKAAPVARPNILLIIADDLASWMLQCYGNQEIKTPNIDYLATGGTRFTNSLVCTPISSASRATLFTGRTPRQHGIIDFLTSEPVENPPMGQKEPPASFAQEIMLSDLLAQAGYNCGYVGKWHMGNDAKPGHGLSYTYTMGEKSNRYQDTPMFLNGDPVQEEGYLSAHMTRRATEFLDRQSADKPFFLTVGYLNPHPPYDGHPLKYYDMYAKASFDSFGIAPAAPNALREKEYLNQPLEYIRKSAAAVTALDDQIPVLRRKLTEKKLAENTLVIFTADNGYLLGRHGLWSAGHASNPINMYEEVMGAPMIWNWPGKVPVQGVRPELVSFYDLLPTLCDVTGIQPPANRNLPGRSYLFAALNRPLAKGEVWQDLVFGEFRNTAMARDARYKVIVRNDGEGPNEFYDLRSDPRERTNQYDNPSYITMRDRLTKELAGWQKRHV